MNTEDKLKVAATIAEIGVLAGGMQKLAYSIQLENMDTGNFNHNAVAELRTMARILSRKVGKANRPFVVTKSQLDEILQHDTDIADAMERELHLNNGAKA